MSRTVAAKVLTVALLAGIVWTFGYARRTSPPAVEAARPAVTPTPAAAAPAADPSDARVSRESPESVVWRMVDAARAGDSTGYLECYTGELEPRLRQNFQDMGSLRSRDYLLDAHRQLKGVAVRSPRMISPQEAEIPVEYVYEDRNELQQVFARRVGGVWKIDRVDGAERIKTLVPYGTPVER